jgi:site-specific recombinase XerD
VVPLSREEATRFFESLRTSRDLAIVSLMLFCGLRSREVLALRTGDVNVLQEELRVRGKGDKDRVLPLARYVRRALSAYVEVERPQTTHDALFVNLKGQARGKPMTPDGLRGLFRYHRNRSGIAKANPHRFRHTFAVDMIRESMPLPVLMRLLGHTSIEMTMRYVNLSAEDVRREFERAVKRLTEGRGDGKHPPERP